MPPIESRELNSDSDLPGNAARSCAAPCASASSLEALNRECFCLAIEPKALQAQLDIVLGRLGAATSLAHSHPHLFSALPYFVARPHIDKIASIVETIEAVVSDPNYQTAVMAWAPESARFAPGSQGGLLGFDFHLGPGGPRLIEINTNPGGVLLNAVLATAQRNCAPDLALPATDAAGVEDAVFAVLLTEWRQQRGDAPLKFVAIVDLQPDQQYLYPEFILFREMCRARGYAAEICSPEQFVHRDGLLWLDGTVVDMVYNRLTDFSLDDPSSQALRAAYLSGEAAVSPHPRAHALYADKRNLTLLCDPGFLESLDIEPNSRDLLLAAVPKTWLVTDLNREALWAKRRQLFFKPAAGFGSKASYRGDKLTRRVWDAIGQGTYVAQEIVAPSERHVGPQAAPLKVDIRCYAYQGQVLLYAARMYQGQTTNFRTPGGGFAPVLTGGRQSLQI
ncbi:MAG: hypothetical protein ABI588_09680 [Arenimonas sp.]